MLIRSKITKLINDTISKNENFEYNDFAIIESNEYSYVKLKITYEYDPSYYITLQIPNSKSSYTREVSRNIMGGVTREDYLDYKIEGKICPGELAFIEEIEEKGKNGIALLIDRWLYNLWDELLTSPVNREFSKQKQEIEELKRKYENPSEEYFSSEEVISMKARLEKLEKDFSEKIRQEIHDQKEVDQKIQDFHKEIEVLKATVSALNKKGWSKSFATKIFTWFSKPENQKLLKAGKDLITSMLPETNEIKTE